MLAVAAFKGGAGKTTLTVNLAGALVASGRRVLVVDGDPQGAAGVALSAKPDKPTLYEVLHGQAAAVEAVRPSTIDGLDVLVSDLDLAGAELELPAMRDWAGAIGRVLRPVQGDYDLVLIDTGPGLGPVPFAGLSAASAVIVCVRPLFLDLRSLHLAFETIGRANRPVLGVVANGVSRRTLHQDEILAEVAKHAGGALLPSIPHRIVLADCALAGQPITDYAPRSDAAGVFHELAQEVLRRAPTTHS